MAGARPEVLVTLTPDLGKLLSALAEVKTSGDLDFLTGIQVAQVRGLSRGLVVSSHSLHSSFLSTVRTRISTSASLPSSEAL